jgi:hypothetical protein
MKAMSMRSAALKWLLPSLLVCAAAGASGQEAPPVIKPVGGVWKAEQAFSFAKKSRKHRQSLSGVACASQSPAGLVCLAVFDEGEGARFFTIGDGVIQPRNGDIRIAKSKGELDAEGAATDGKFFYVTGSHSAQRNSCASNPASRYVMRFQVNPATGRALRSKRGELAGYESSTRLWSIMAGVPELKEHVGEQMCLGSEPVPKSPEKIGKRGVNIEGVAVRADKLYFGFRGPASGGKALVLAVETEAIFGKSEARPAVVSMDVGAGRGVRDLLAVDDGLLVLAGPDDDAANESVGWTIGHLSLNGDGAGARFRTLATLDLSDVRLRRCDKEIKPEALTLLPGEAGQPYRVLVFSDGMCDGGPLLFEAPRP